MGFGEILKRAIGIAPKTSKGISPDEVELMSYEEQERRRQIKRRLEFYRKLEARRNWAAGRQLLKSKSILAAKNAFRK